MNVFFSKNHLYWLTVIFLLGCIEPETPEFNFKEGLIYIDAFVSTSPEESYVKISESGFKFNKFVNDFLPNVDVRFKNTETNVIIQLTEEDGIYLPLEGFHASVGDTWELLITLPDGRNYQSLPENIIQPVGFSNLKANYSSELLFREGFNSFIPGHSISADINNPTNEKNFYFWTYKLFEEIRLCPPKAGGSYLICETDCWKIRFYENIKLFSDEFNNAETINAVPIADIPYYDRGDILVKIHQYSLSESAYNYFKVIKDLIDNNSGINAPPPVALSGNLFNPNDDDEFVLGRFTAASTSTKHIFIDRSDITETPIGPLPIVRFPILETTPCTENRFRTSIEPEGWQ
ncbi:DUF4249 domain-containing protein [Flavivirga abyssicola]|uniref:DUF4249 domain-containing protein n=1 Tax=Flavivirga abyssicola TaxID=3063533 RepID=UPI0026E076BE|nr:DUF4249 domain-containing protein [Flavivirga sp. MEBiC07777]WVK11916.1 DUF4249 domain-containing protein [Flavivirga sp. MEBiC07777]